MSKFIEVAALGMDSYALATGNIPKACEACIAVDDVSAAVDVTPPDSEIYITAIRSKSSDNIAYIAEYVLKFMGRLNKI